jgi:hypothetical protein
VQAARHPSPRIIRTLGVDLEYKLSIQNNTSANIRIGAWFVIGSTLFVVGCLSLIGMVGLDGMLLLLAVPNLAIFAFCGVTLALWWLYRPKIDGSSRSTVVAVTTSYLLVIGVVLWLGVPFGFYRLTIHVINDRGVPISGVSVRILGQKTGMSIRDVFVPHDLATNTSTNEHGDAFATISRFQHIGGLVNVHGAMGANVGTQYRFAEFQLVPGPDGRVSGHTSWSKKGEEEHSNMRSSKQFVIETGHAVLQVFLPEAGGRDSLLLMAPNQSPEPTLASGTSPAGQEPRLP